MPCFSASSLQTLLAQRNVCTGSNCESNKDLAGEKLPGHPGACGRKLVLFMRHGETEHNRLFHQGKCREAQDLRDPLLTAIGQTQAEEAANSLLLHSAMCSPGVLLVISPLRRAIETAASALGHWLIERKSAGIPVRVELALDIQECGVHKCNVGRPASELRMEFGQTSVGPFLPFDKLAENWFERNGDYADSPEAIATRLARFTHWIHLQPEPNIIVISHQQVFWNMLGASFSNCEIRSYTIDDSCELMSRIHAGQIRAVDLPLAPPWSAVCLPELPLRSYFNHRARARGDFHVHTNPDFGDFCCSACAEDGNHSPQCQRTLALRGGNKLDMRGGVKRTMQELQVSMCKIML